MKSEDIHNVLVSVADPAIAIHSQRFFKTGKGEYGEGDRFLGIRVPVLRKLVGKYRELSLATVSSLLKSPYHEERLLALLLLVDRFCKGTQQDRSRIYNLYLENTKYINNWDLVDSSAHHIVGVYLDGGDHGILYTMASSSSLWERRIAIMSTFCFIKQGEYETTLQLARILLNDSEDLIHKAVGWMLREIGKRDVGTEREFLDKHYQKMPRTMLRYAIERFPEDERKGYLHGTTK